MKRAEGLPELFDFVFRGVFFAFGLIEDAKNFLDVIEHMAQFGADALDLLDGSADAGRRRRMMGLRFGGFGLVRGRGPAAAITARTTPKTRAPRAVPPPVLGRWFCAGGFFFGRPAALLFHLWFRSHCHRTANFPFSGDKINGIMRVPGGQNEGDPANFYRLDAATADGVCVICRKCRLEPGSRSAISSS